jgi:hypothetical protein
MKKREVGNTFRDTWEINKVIRICWMGEKQEQEVCLRK